MRGLVVKGGPSRACGRRPARKGQARDKESGRGCLRGGQAGEAKMLGVGGAKSEGSRREVAAGPSIR